MRNSRDAPGPSSRTAPLAGRGLAALALGAALTLLAGPGAAVELLDGDVQIHGFVETQVRGIARDFDVGDGLDLTQWYWVANLELEWDVAPDGFGPFDSVGAYARFEVRYDCVWTRACGLFPSANTYGDHAAHLPERLSDARRNGFIGVIEPTDVGGVNRSDKRRRIGTPLGQGGDEFASGPLARPVPNADDPGRFWQLPSLGDFFFSVPGYDPDGVDGNRDPLPQLGLRDDDVSGCLTGSTSPLPCRYPGAYVAENFLDHRFGMAAQPGNVGGNGFRLHGPWRPKDKIVGWGALRDRVNPYDPTQTHPVLRAFDGSPLAGQGALPFRPAAAAPADANGDGRIDALDEAGPFVSRGLYYPNAGLLRALGDPDFDQRGVNFGQSRLAWNQGRSQEQTRELKEAYLDLEMLDHRLWVRAGRQTIVWGKTELFRSQDQFNPQDLGLSSLPTLEESRVPLWSGRAIYSLYDVGALEDVRLEGAVIFDRFLPTDLGRCGEPYAPPQACDLSAGLFAHGIAGVGLAGGFEPRDPWDDTADLEGGIRAEWRWGRFSFSLSDFYGYEDFPHVRLLFAYERNVDPTSGRPRRAGATGPCVEGNEPACLGGVVAGDVPGDPAETTYPGLARPPADDVLRNHPANQQLFAAICGSTLTALASLPEACALNVWNSQEDAIPGDAITPTFAQAFAVMLAGHGRVERIEAGANPLLVPANGKQVWLTNARLDSDRSPPLVPSPAGTGEDVVPLVPLHFNTNVDPDTGVPYDGVRFAGDRAAAFPDATTRGIWTFVGLDVALTVEQDALLGCGDYWGTDCDAFGFDVLNAEGSAVLQSFPGVEGTEGSDWDTYAGGRRQPGTIGFDGGPWCTRFVPSGGTLVLPGCRGALSHELDAAASELVVTFQSGYDPRIDGCVFAPTVGGNDVVGRYPDGSPVDLSPCVAGPGAIIRTLYHPFAGCLSDSELSMPGASCDVSERDYDAEFLGLVPGRSAQVFRSEMAALSWNFMMVLVGASTPPDKLGGGPAPCDPAGPKEPDGCSDRAPRFDEFDANDPERVDGCSFRKPFLCKNVHAFLMATAAGRNTLRAGGNPRYGRRDFAWHGGASVALDHVRRNVLGFSMDWAEDTTLTNWSVEVTWVDRAFRLDADEPGLVAETDLYNLSISVDRPTFIRFLNPSRTFFMNSQLFVQYVGDYHKSFLDNGPVNTRMTFAVSTGYHQDRLLPSFLVAHDFPSDSGALITSLTYRYTENFSATVGLAAFYGRVQTKDAPLTGLTGPPGGAGAGSQRSYVENGLTSVRNRDEVFLRIRYTF